MSDKVKFEPNDAGIRELLKNPKIVQDATNAVLRRVGAGYEGDVQVHNRAVGRVYARTRQARKDNSENNTLLKALHE